jgi:hypothetical protein
LQQVFVSLWQAINSCRKDTLDGVGDVDGGLGGTVFDHRSGQLFQEE